MSGSMILDKYFSGKSERNYQLLAEEVSGESDKADR